MSERMMSMRRTQLEKLVADLETIEVRDGRYGFSKTEVSEARGVVSSAFATRSKETIILTVESVDPRSITARSLVKLLPELRALVRRLHNSEEIVCGAMQFEPLPHLRKAINTNNCRLDDSTQWLMVADEVGNLTVRSAVDVFAKDYSIFKGYSIYGEKFIDTSEWYRDYQEKKVDTFRLIE